jgi:sugar/nucleoside kinase (ribokinase family)
MKKIVGLGACVVDTPISCAAFPTEDKKQPASSIKKAPGGPVCNALVIASRLGASTQVIGAFADDEGGKFILSGDTHRAENLCYGFDTWGKLV